MRLIRIAVDGLKNLRDVDLAVPRLWALAGQNGSGKTALQQGVKLAVLGHDPDKGKTLSATRELASDDRGIEVGLTFEDGFAVKRILGKSTETEVMPPEGESTEKARQARIDRETGAFPFSFDLKAFLDLSAEKRRDFLFGLLPRGAAELDEVTFRSWLGYDDADETIRRGIDHLWQAHMVEAQTPIDGLASAIDVAHTRMLDAERERQTRATISADANRDAARASEAVAEHDPEALADLQAEVTVVEQRLGELRAKAEEGGERTRAHGHAVRVAEMRVGQATEELEQLRARQDAAGTAASDAEVQAAAEAVASARAALAEDSGMSDEDRERLREMAETEERIRIELAALREEASTAATALAGAQARTEDLGTRLGQLEGADSCPVCGTEADLERARADFREGLAAAEAEVDALTAAQAERRQRIHETTGAHVAAATAAQDERAAAQRRALERRSRLSDELAAATERLGALRQATESHGSVAAQMMSAEKRLAAATEELEDLRAHAPAPVEDTTEEQARLAGRAEALRGRIRELQEAARAAGKAEALREQAEKKRRELEVAEYRAEAFKRLYSGLQKLRAKAIESMVAPVEARAREILEAIDPEKRFAFRFEREGRPVLDFGFEQGGVFRSYDAASTGEDAFLAVVLVAATIAAVQPAWRVLMIDNVEQVDDVRRAALQEALARPEIAALFDNVILAGCCSFQAAHGWEVLDVEAMTQAPAEVAA